MSLFQLIASRNKPVVITRDERKIHTSVVDPYYRKLNSLNWQSTNTLDSYANRIQAFDWLADYSLYLQKWELAKARYSPTSPFFSWPCDLMGNLSSYLRKSTSKTYDNACDIRGKIFKLSPEFKYRSEWESTSLNKIPKIFRQATVHGAKNRKTKLHELRPFLLAINWRLGDS